MESKTVYAAIDSLLDYAKNCELLHPLDGIFARNSLLAELKLESYERQIAAPANMIVGLFHMKLVYVIINAGKE